MEYFIIGVNSNYTPPCPKKCNMLLQRNLEITSNYLKLPKHLILKIEKHMQMINTDIITYPNFCVSRKIKEVIELYQPGTYFKRLIFYDETKGNSFPYFLPLLETVSCFSENTVYNADKSFIKFPEIDGEKVKGRILFRAQGVNCNCILGRLDFVESMLRRNALGIGLKQVQQKNR